MCSKAWAGPTLPRVTPRSQPEAASPVSLSAAPSPAQQLHLAEGNHSGRAILCVTERYTLCYRAILRLAERYSALQSHTLSCRAMLRVTERCSESQSVCSRQGELPRWSPAPAQPSSPCTLSVPPSPVPPAVSRAHPAPVCASSALTKVFPRGRRRSPVSQRAPGAARAGGTSPSCASCAPCPGQHTAQGKQHRHWLRGSLKNDPQVTQAWVSNSSAGLFHTGASTRQVQRVYSRRES